MFDVCIVGGGASGMATAIAIKNINRELEVCILEKKEAVGRKLVATGNGKCNLTNVRCRDYAETLEFFGAVGTVTRADSTGRVYPYSEDAAELTALFEDRLAFYNVQIITGATVTKVTALATTSNSNERGGFRIEYTAKAGDTSKSASKVASKRPSAGQLLEARNVVIATGGKAGPQFGSTGDGYAIAKSFGHHVTKLAPALAAVDTVDNLKSLAGVRAKGQVSLIRACGENEFETLFCEEGEIQFTKDGLSGICVFNMSRYLKIPDGKTLDNGFEDYLVCVNFLTGSAPDGVLAGLGTAGSQGSATDNAVAMLTARQQIQGLKTRDILRTIVKEPLAQDILARSGVNTSRGELQQEAACLTQKQIENIAKNLTCWTCRVKGVKGWNFAQATAGGVELSEINLTTMESKLVSGLFFTGEVIDYDGPCGGYNLQNAWVTAMKAGRAIAGK